MHAVLSSAEFYMFFFSDNLQKFFQKYHRSNSLDPGQTTCWASSGSKLFAEQQTAKSVMPLVRKELIMMHVVHFQKIKFQ